MAKEKDFIGEFSQKHLEKSRLNQAMRGEKGRWKEGEKRKRGEWTREELRIKNVRGQNNRFI